MKSIHVLMICNAMFTEVIDNDTTCFPLQSQIGNRWCSVLQAPRDDASLSTRSWYPAPSQPPTPCKRHAIAPSAAFSLHAVRKRMRCTLLAHQSIVWLTPHFHPRAVAPPLPSALCNSVSSAKSAKRASIPIHSMNSHNQKCSLQLSKTQGDINTSPSFSQAFYQLPVVAPRCRSRRNVLRSREASQASHAAPRLRVCRPRTCSVGTQVAGAEPGSCCSTARLAALSVREELDEDRRWWRVMVTGGDLIGAGAGC